MPNPVRPYPDALQDPEYVGFLNEHIPGRFVRDGSGLLKLPQPLDGSERTGYIEFCAPYITADKDEIARMQDAQGADAKLPWQIMYSLLALLVFAVSISTGLSAAFNTHQAVGLAVVSLIGSVALLISLTFFPAAEAACADHREKIWRDRLRLVRRETFLPSQFHQEIINLYETWCRYKEKYPEEVEVDFKKHDLSHMFVRANVVAGVGAAVLLGLGTALLILG
ncbi:MAG TPA: hypothetical protein VNG90_04170, partial [Candidatus Acidoferrum sp.]|nr:hypothetical protein [Candidatus Acidoferrum sp.]